VDLARLDRDRSRWSDLISDDDLQTPPTLTPGPVGIHDKGANDPRIEVPYGSNDRRSRRDQMFIAADTTQPRAPLGAPCAAAAHGAPLERDFWFGVKL
jgi:hypothetical protein